jgi:murein DD-endopeptidase MepM/ murein hydrolase activator NlpD
MWDELQQLSPQTVFIFRTQTDVNQNVIGDGPGSIYTGDPIQTARDWMALMMPMWAINKAHYYAPLNEQDPSDLAGFKWLDTFSIECMKIAEASGYKLALYAFSGGNPKNLMKPGTEEVVSTQQECWAELIPSLKMAKANGHILLLHEYGFDSAAKADAPATTLRASAPYLALRYRAVYEQLRANNADPLLVIAEASMGVGFKGNDPAVFMQDAEWYDKELCKDSWVIGCCLYQLGGAENLMDLLPQLADYISITPTPKVDPPADQKQRGAPRTQYARKFVLCGPGTSDALGSRIYNTLRKYGVTIGDSADDAGIGDLDSRTVYAVRPDQWPSPLTQAWFTTNYSGANMVTITGTDDEIVAALLGKFGKVAPPTPPQSAQVADKFDAPIGTVLERSQRSPGKWPGKWYDATGYAKMYTVPPNPTAYHTGADFNLPNDGDAHAAVFAPANGMIVFAGELAVWGKVVIIKHVLPNGAPLWSRLAHLEAIMVAKGAVISIGEQVGTVGNANGRYAYHLHYDIASIDLGATPGDWPGMNLAKVKGNYVNPLIMMDPPVDRGPIAVGLHDIGGIDYMLKNGKQGVGGAVSSAPLLVSRAKLAT